MNDSAVSLGGPNRRRRLRLINPYSPLSTITMPEIIQKMTFSRRALFMPLNWRLAGPEHLQMLEDCPPSLFFVEPAQYETMTSDHWRLTSFPGGEDADVCSPLVTCHCTFQ